MTDLQQIVWSDPDRLGGVPCFVGTRVPVHSLFDHLGEGDTLDDFLDNFPTVRRAQAKAVLNLAAERIEDSAQKQAEDRRTVQATTRTGGRSRADCGEGVPRLCGALQGQA
jgi:uncharacterized protein (DUF433 family)